MQIVEALAEELEWLYKTIQRMVEEHNDKVLQAFAEQRAMYAAEFEKERAERRAEKAEREKADAALHEIFRLLEAERDAREELEAKNAELEEEIAEMKERITARKLKKKEAAI